MFVQQICTGKDVRIYVRGDLIKSHRKIDAYPINPFSKERAENRAVRSPGHRAEACHDTIEEFILQRFREERETHHRCSYVGWGVASLISLLRPPQTCPLLCLALQAFSGTMPGTTQVAKRQSL